MSSDIATLKALLGAWTPRRAVSSRPCTSSHVREDASHLSSALALPPLKLSPAAVVKAGRRPSQSQRSGRVGHRSSCAEGAARRVTAEGPPARPSPLRCATSRSVGSATSMGRARPSVRRRAGPAGRTSRSSSPANAGRDGSTASVHQATARRRIAAAAPVALVDFHAWRRSTVTSRRRSATPGSSEYAPRVATRSGATLTGGRPRSPPEGRRTARWLVERSLASAVTQGWRIFGDDLQRGL